jgi:predicted glutamine amidotransferase
MTSGANTTRATFWLLEAGDSLEQQSRSNPDGTGIGIFDDDDRPRVLKQALAADHDLDFAREARELVSRTFVAHVRHASQGGISELNTHPFTLDGRIFAHNGGFGDLPALERHLGDDLALVRGDTDSERLFALVTREIRERGDVAEGLVAAVGWVAEQLPVLALNVVLATPEELWAIRYPETHTLYVLASEEGSVEHRSDEGTRVSADHAPARVVVASERLDDDPGWEEVSSGELVHVGPDLTITRTQVWDRPPPRMMHG